MDCALSIMKPVLCVGCTVIDFVTINSKFPEEDTDTRCLKGFWQRGGNASNVCTVLRLLGASVEFFGVLSRSSAFRVLLDDMRQRSIDVHHCPRTDEDPPFSSVILAQNTGSRTIVHCNNNFPQVTVEDFKLIDLNRYGWVHFEARNIKETMKMIRVVLDHNNGIENKILISLDFESSFDEHLELCDMCDYVVLSKELALKQGWLTAQEACKELDYALGLRRVLILHRPSIICPWGEEGASCLDPENNFYKLDAYKPKKVVDTLGAGDCFMAGLIYAIYVRQRLLQDAVDFANRVASYKISQFGYDHIADLNAIAVPDTNNDDDTYSMMASEDDGLTEAERICKKYLNRTIDRKHINLTKALQALDESAQNQAKPFEDPEYDMIEQIQSGPHLSIAQSERQSARQSARSARTSEKLDKDPSYIQVVDID